MYKRLFFCICLISAIVFVGCLWQRNNIDQQLPSIIKTAENGTGNLTKWAIIYQSTLESYLLQDKALNENIDFIAINLSKLEFANDEDKKSIAAWFEKHYVPVKDTNLAGLKAEGLYDEKRMSIPNGVLLTIHEIIEKNNEIIIRGTKYRASEGANGFETKWQLNNGIWKFVETVMIWIS